MLHTKILRAIGILAVFFLCALNARAQRVRGELRLEVHDPHGAAVSPAGELISEANGIRRTFVAGAGGGPAPREVSSVRFFLCVCADGVLSSGDFCGI